MAIGAYRQPICSKARHAAANEAFAGIGFLVGISRGVYQRKGSANICYE